jgi:hypothetical protein
VSSINDGWCTATSFSISSAELATSAAHPTVDLEPVAEVEEGIAGDDRSPAVNGRASPILRRLPVPESRAQLLRRRHTNRCMTMSDGDRHRAGTHV